MSFSKRVRTRIASSLSKLEETETFLWIKLLRPGDIDYREIEKFFTDLWEIDNSSLKVIAIEEISSYIINFNRVKTLKLSQRKLILKSKTNPVFFNFGNISVSNIEISFDHQLQQCFAARIIVEGTSVHFNIIDQKKKEISSELTSKIINLRKHLLNSENLIDASSTKGEIVHTLNYFIKEPKIIDCLSQLKPEIYNIELLTRIEYSESDMPVSSTKIDLLDRSVPLKRIDEIELRIKEEQLYSPFEFNPQISIGSITLHSDLFPWNTRQIKINIPEFNDTVKAELSVFYEKDSTSPIIKDGGTKALIADGINKIIQPKIDLSPEEEGILFENLYPFQVQGAKSLTSNSNVLFSNEPATGKTIQAIFAIRYLIKKREIKYCLVMTNESTADSNSIESDTRRHFGWPGKLAKFAPELSFNNLDSEPNDFNSMLTDNSQVQIITYEMLSFILTGNKAKKDIFKKYECVIFDNAEQLNKYQNEVLQLIHLIRPKFNWIIANLNWKDYAETISPELNPRNFLSHNYEDIRPQLPEINESEFWIDMGKDHRDEFHQVFFHAQNSLQDIQATGNPFRFQSQLFLYIHQLNQASNFPVDNIESNKAILLLSHVKSLKSYNKQVIVFSQYDKAGIQKLARLFDREQIKYKKYSQGMTPGDLSNAVSEFEKDTSITVFLADTQIIKAKSQKVYAPYIIHFDQWWTPVSKWELENKIRSSSSRQIVVLNYFTKNTLDEKIQSALFEKGMLDRKNSGKIGADAFSKILSEEEWSKIFELEKVKKPDLEKDKNDDTVGKVD